MMLDINPELPTSPSADGAASLQHSEPDSSWEIMNHDDVPIDDDVDSVQPPEIGTDAVLATVSAVQIVESDDETEDEDEEDEDDEEDDASDDEAEDETAVAQEVAGSNAVESQLTKETAEQQNQEEEVIKEMLYKDLVSYILEGEQTRTEELAAHSNDACVSAASAVRNQVVYVVRNHTTSILFACVSMLIAMFVCSRVRSTNLPSRIHELELKVAELQSTIDSFPYEREHAVRSAIDQAVKKYSPASQLPAGIAAPAEEQAASNAPLAYRHYANKPHADQDKKPFQPNAARPPLKYVQPNADKPYDAEHHRRKYDSDNGKKYDSVEQRRDFVADKKKPHDSTEHRDSSGKGNGRKYGGDQYKKKYDSDVGKVKADRNESEKRAPKKYQTKPYADKYAGSGKHADARKASAFQKERYDSNERNGKYEHDHNKDKHHD